MSQKEQILKIIERNIEFHNLKLNLAEEIVIEKDYQKRNKEWAINYHSQKLSTLKSILEQIKEEVK
ncbi:MAG: hypothetical protein K2N64_01055 [Anaeroplasmataceae bacterium]|nr:hypothetical protein [Anaeroplasmataceae bacterium]